MKKDAEEAAERLLHILDYGLFPCEYGIVKAPTLPHRVTEFSPLITSKVNPPQTSHHWVLIHSGVTGSQGMSAFLFNNLV